MLSFLTGHARGCFSLTLLALTTVFWVSLLVLMAFLKAIIPIPSWRKFCSRLVDGCANNWIFCNNLNLRLTRTIHWDVQGLDSLKQDEWYLVLANHQSWIDIVVLQKVFYHKIPFLKFFLKKELIWVPVLGIAWWALDFPFMKRYSRKFLEKFPHLRGKDVEITRKACEKFKTIPVSVMNFVEGTRFTPEKHRKQESPHQYLLKPKAGGIAFVLATMGEQLHRILNVTIVYPEGKKNFWAFLCGRVCEIRVRVETLPISEDILGDYVNDVAFRKYFQNWVNALWDEKDKYIESLVHPPRSVPQQSPDLAEAPFRVDPGLFKNASERQEALAKDRRLGA